MPVVEAVAVGAANSTSTNKQVANRAKFIEAAMAAAVLEAYSEGLSGNAEAVRERALEAAKAARIEYDKSSK